MIVIVLAIIGWSIIGVAGAVWIVRSLDRAMKVNVLVVLSEATSPMRGVDIQRELGWQFLGSVYVALAGLVDMGLAERSNDSGLIKYAATPKGMGTHAVTAPLDSVEEQT